MRIEGEKIRRGQKERRREEGRREKEENRVQKGRGREQGEDKKLGKKKRGEYNIMHVYKFLDRFVPLAPTLTRGGHWTLATGHAYSIGKVNCKYRGAPKTPPPKKKKLYFQQHDFFHPKKCLKNYNFVLKDRQ